MEKHGIIKKKKQELEEEENLLKMDKARIDGEIFNNFEDFDD